MLTVDYARLGIDPGSVVVDLGCGKGRHSFEALRRGARVYAIDLDHNALAEVAAMASAMASVGETPPSASCICINASASALPLAAGSVDVVIASEVLEHIADDELALSEIVRVLKPAGVAVVSVPRKWPEKVCWALSDDYHNAAGGHVRIYRSSALKARLRRTGLAVTASHHSHALHSPYWWLRCAFGIDNDDAHLPALYHRFLVWDITTQNPLVRGLERVLNPVAGKSLVVYSEKRDA